MSVFTLSDDRADAHDVYAANGFYPLIRPDRYMERLAPDFADALRTAP
jgi:hypothetical protein